jgi:hypothetical protein
VTGPFYLYLYIITSQGTFSYFKSYYTQDAYTFLSVSKSEQYSTHIRLVWAGHLMMAVYSCEYVIQNQKLRIS